MSLRLEFEEDGPYRRWVLMLGDRRLAKGSRWWESEDDARTDYEAFAEAVEQNPPTRIEGAARDRTD